MLKSMSNSTVSSQLVDILIGAGVTHVFGVIGDALNALAQAIQQSEEIQWVAVRHEGNGSFAAFAQAELSGKLGVCAGTVGPGALHLINGLYNAKRERSPVLAITGQVPVAQIGTDYHQEVNLERVYEDVCAYQAIVRSPDEAPRLFQRAIQTALSQRTVSRIELPADVANMAAASGEFVHPIVRAEATVVPAEEQILRLSELLAGKQHVTILAGAGCRDARQAVLQLADRLHAPIVHTLRASDIFDHDCRHVVGLTGLIGNPTGYQAVESCDLLLMLGTDFPYSHFLPHDTATAQIDVRSENLGNRTAVDLGIQGDVRETVERLLPHVPQRDEPRFHRVLCEGFEKWKSSMRQSADTSRDHEPLHPQMFARLVNEHASDDAVFVVDTGAATVWAARHISFHGHRRLIGSFNHGSMAVGVPAALGAQILYPDREVWALVGDGAFTMAMQDWVTVAKRHLPIKMLVFHNGSLGFVKLEMEVAGIVPEADILDVNVPDLAAYSRWCGAEGIRVEHAADAASAVERAKAATSPIVIDAVVSDGELMMPPHIEAGQVAGMASSKVKQALMALSGDGDQWNNLKEELAAYFDSGSV